MVIFSCHIVGIVSLIVSLIVSFWGFDVVFDDMKYLFLRNKIYWYKRKIPKVLSEVLGGFYHRESLGTDNVEIAKKKRDALVDADNDYWAELKAGGTVLKHEALYERVVGRAKSLRLQYMTSDKMADDLNVEQLLGRIDALETALGSGAEISQAAIIGSVELPRHKISDVLEIYIEKIMAHELAKKNDAQRHRWKTSHERYVRNFIGACGDIAIDDINRADGLAYRDYFSERVLEPDLDLRIDAASANREIGSLAVIYKRYYKYLGTDSPHKPFVDLKFKEAPGQRRDYFEVKWLKNLLLKPELIEGLNYDARLILLCMVETGMRPIEICNIDIANVIYEKGCPHVIIEPRDGYELKTDSSRRVIPLVGVSAIAFIKLAEGYVSRYRGKPNGFSAVVNKFFRTNKLFEREGQTIYSMRHTFKNRMIEAGIDEEMRDMLMGHSNARPDYGDGGSIEHKYRLLQGMNLEYDMRLFSGGDA